MFSTQEECDSHEFLVKLIDVITDNNKKDFINEYFQMKVEETIFVCCYDPPKWQTIEHVEHQLYVSKNATIDELLEEWFREDSHKFTYECGIDGSNHTKAKESSDEKVTLKKSYNIIMLPKILLFRLLYEESSSTIKKLLKLRSIELYHFQLILLIN